MHKYVEDSSVLKTCTYFRPTTFIMHLRYEYSEHVDFAEFIN